MKNPSDSRTKTDDLPSFLHSTEDADSRTEAVEGTSTDDTPDAATPQVLATEPEGAGEDVATDSTMVTEIDATPATGRRSRTVVRTTPRGGTGSMLLGGGMLVAAVVLALLPNREATLAGLARFGVEPASLMVAGLVLVLAGTNRRRLGTLQEQIDQTRNHESDTTTSLRESLQFLVDAQHASNERPPAAGEELQHVLIALQRQDEKINNLTKAIKMYGKPLMEISGQGTELAGSLNQAKTSIEAGNDAAVKALARIETQLKSQGTPGKEFAELAAAVQKVGAAVDALQKKGNAGPSLEPLQQQVGRLEVSVAAIGQRLEDSELRKSLLRLEDTTQKARDDMQQLLRGENLQKATTQLQDRLDKATGRLTEGLTQMRDGHIGGLETSIREIQREISGVATTVAQIQASVKSGARATAAPAPAAAATPAPAPAPERTPAPTAPTTPAADSAGTGYSTGTRSSGGKNVLGAIAKLKQMKT